MTTIIMDTRLIIIAVEKPIKDPSRGPSIVIDCEPSIVVDCECELITVLYESVVDVVVD